METTLNRKRRGHFTKGKQLMMSIYKGTMSSIRSSSTKVKPSPSPYPSPAHHHVVGSGYNTNVVMNQLTDVTQQVLPKQQKVLHPPPPPHHHHLEFIVNQDQVVPHHQSKQKVFVGSGGGRQSQHDSYNGILHDNINYNKLYGVAVDESVDIKAATYISTVRERLWLH